MRVQRNLRRMAAVGAALAATAGAARAIPYSWQGPDGGSWATPGNWNPGGTPGAGDTATFATTNPPVSSATVNLGAPQSISGLTFQNLTWTIRDDGPGFTLTLSGAGTIPVQVDSAATIDAVVAGVGITKTGTATLTLTKANTYTGPTVINGGTISVGILAPGGTPSGIGASDNSASNLVFNGGTLLYTGGTTSTDRNFTLNAGGGTINVSSGPLTISGGGTSSGGLTKAGVGTLILTGTSNYTGGTTISAGTLQIGSGGTGGSVTNTITNNATLTYTKSGTETIEEAITGTGALNVNGTATLTFTANNAYTTGTTAISSSGKVYVASGGTLGAPTAGQVNVTGTATLGGEGTVGGSSVNYATGTFLDPGNGVTATDTGVLTLSNALNLNGGATARIDFNDNFAPTAGAAYDQVRAGAVTLGGALNPVVDNSGPMTYAPNTVLKIIDGTSLSGQFSNFANGAEVTQLQGFGGISNWFIFYDTAAGDVNIVPVPEPASLLGVAAVGLGLARWVRRRRKPADAVSA